VSEAPLFAAIAEGAVAESPLWAESLRPVAELEAEAVFSPLVPDPRLALGVETIYEGYLLHNGRSRLFAPTDEDIALLLGDTLLAHGLVRVSALGNVVAVSDLATLLSLCSQQRAEGRDGDGAAWAATASLLGLGGLDEARTALRDDHDPAPLLALARAHGGEERVELALAAHRRRMR